MLLFSLLLWGFLFWLDKQLPGKSKIAYAHRGGGGGDTTTTSHTYYYYKIKFPHTSIDPNQPILFYDAFGTLVYTLPANYQFMNYGEGVLSVPGDTQNTTVEGVSTASYYVYYSSDDLLIDYENGEFKIAKKLIKVPASTVVKGTFEYLTVVTPFKDIASVIDGRWDTQVQSEFFAEPPTGYNYAIFDLGSVKAVQAIDIVAGFYKPDEIRRFDIDFNSTLQYSINGTDYYDIGDATHNFQLTGGSSVSFEEKDLGVGFQARYFKLLLENVRRIEYTTDGVYVVAITEIAVYNDIVLKSEAKLIPTTTLSSDLILPAYSGDNPTTLTVESTTSFNDPESGLTETAYILNSDGTYDNFTYTGLTATQFTGVAGLTEDHDEDSWIVQEIAGDATYYDYNNLLPKLQDRIYKVNKVSESTLYTQSQLDYVAKAYLREFVKNHSKIQVQVLYSPHIEIGQTIKVVDTYNDTNQNYFVESIQDSNGFYTLTLARYPAT